jgi:hypothetical protein
MEELEYSRLGITATEWTMQYINLTIALITNICCIYLVPVQLYWWVRLHKTSRYLPRQFLVAAIIKSGIWCWTFDQILRIVIWNMDLLNTTLAARLLFFVGVILHVFMTFGYYGGKESSPANYDKHPAT